MLQTELAALFSRDLTRLARELRAFPDTTAVWATVPGITNAAGSLVLHLEGNLREYIGRQLGQIPYTRDRQREFSERGVERADLIARIEAVSETIPPLVESLSNGVLDAPYPEQVLGAPMSTRYFLLHLYGHLNYHLGQIDYVRRAITGDGALTPARA